MGLCPPEPNSGGPLCFLLANSSAAPRMSKLTQEGSNDAAQRAGSGERQNGFDECDFHIHTGSGGDYRHHDNDPTLVPGCPSICLSFIHGAIQPCGGQVPKAAAPRAAIAITRSQKAMNPRAGSLNALPSPRVPMTPISAPTAKMNTVTNTLSPKGVEKSSWLGPSPVS